MPRKRSRADDDDFDDEDDEFVPRKRERETGGSGTPLMLFGGVGAGVLVLVVLGFTLFSARKAKQEAMVAERAAMEQQMLAEETRRFAADAEARAVRPAPQGTPGANWKKVIGKWSRPPNANEVGGYPYEFEFRADRTVTMTRFQNGQVQRQEATAEVSIDSGETLSLTLHIPMGMYGYSFNLKPDGTLVLDDRQNGIVFQRER